MSIESLTARTSWMVTILDQAFDGLVVFHAVGVDEEIKSFIGFAFGLGHPDCQSALNFDPLSASNIDPSCGREEVVPVVNRGAPRGFV